MALTLTDLVEPDSGSLPPPPLSQVPTQSFFGSSEMQSCHAASSKCSRWKLISLPGRESDVGPGVCTQTEKAHSLTSAGKGRKEKEFSTKGEISLGFSKRKRRMGSRQVSDSFRSD